MQVIIFRNNDQGHVSVVIPAEGFAEQIADVAVAVVPDGAAFRFIEQDDLPPVDMQDRWRWTDTGPLDVVDLEVDVESSASLSLTPAQWQYFLDLTGFREALDAALAAMPKGNLAERSAWAMMRSVAYASESYGLSVTLQLVAQVRGLGLPINIPADAEIEEAFRAAATFEGAKSLLGGAA